MPLPAAATFITSWRYCQGTKVPLAPLGGIPIVLDDVVADKEDVDNADEGPAEDYTILVNEAVLMVNGGTNLVRMRIRLKGGGGFLKRGYTRLFIFSSLSPSLAREPATPNPGGPSRFSIGAAAYAV